MQTDVSNVLSDLITLSNDADQIILDTNFGNDQVNQWFSFIKETASAIVNGTYCSASTSAEKPSSFSAEDLPSLVTLVKGKKSPSISTCLLDDQKDKRARLSHRKSRKSLRKIILGKGRSNQWKISSRKSSCKEIETVQEEDGSTTPIPSDKLLEGKLDITATIKQHSKSYFSELDTNSINASQSEFQTPIQNKKSPSTVTRSKVKTAAKVEVDKNNVTFSLQNSSFKSDCNHPDSGSLRVTKSNSEENKDDEFLTPLNNTISISSDSSSDGNKYETPVTRSKRKSSVQHSQENSKKIKSSATSQVHSGKGRREDNFTGNNTFKKVKSAKDMNPVIPASTKNLPQQNQTRPEKRILREIQKKEEKVSQNAKKIRSLQKLKIEENKKAREMKMEKAMQQRMKIEKEKEERIRSRTQSRQENVQQMEPATKKGAMKKVEKVKSGEKPLSSLDKKVKTSPIKQTSSKYKTNVVDKTIYTNEPYPKESANTLNNINSTYNTANNDIISTPSSSNEKAPPKPLRNGKKPNEISGNKTSDYGTLKGSILSSASSSNSTFIMKAGCPLSSTPAVKKIESKINVAKTPISNNAKKPNSYAMTPQETSLVSYDISEIKSDDSDDESSPNQTRKQIPTWASGINLKTAILQQHYAPIKIDELFGNYFTPPKLQDIMGMEKKHYHKRTSSAIWLESPNRSRSFCS